MSDELDVPVPGSGAIIVYDKKLTDPFLLLRFWVDFFMKRNCDKCVPCREGLLRIREMVDKKKFDKKTLDDLYFVLENTSFCPPLQLCLFRSLWFQTCCLCGYSLF
ncbi:MAG: hypothetical protein COT25_03085 [Candidatus Kerfeldbacteria bacterium CG08_land_8_20_14_0_20_42_7]|uniref:NADH-ubiquinone oxidoreductase 51kDa subunit iron-sulphur binding domain-containing protein n=1 Tax=Candidatus Kerfeldbacteria bacterium CG08_land_8_20_14_0_20_42_7 TaxID=2014245 RepID=A0A2H0YSG8_9BACT|nr:MAG: hypothetical protein COT25_03085 [Candidatus Kerfeldbacteria bacterium CG08_land_8_20_14_0_20_42_7]